MSGAQSGSALSPQIAAAAADEHDTGRKPDTPADPPPPVLTSETRQTQWRRANLSKDNAHMPVRQAMAAGRLHKQPCEVCGAATVDAHHDRCDQPLAVRWLCRTHHAKLHSCGEDMVPVGASSGSSAIRGQE